MGAVSVETYNIQLMSLADYSNRKSIKRLYRNLDNLLGLRECGDTVAASICIDLITALNSKGVTELQRECVRLHLIQKAPLKEIAQIMDRSPSTIFKAVSGGIANIQAVLNGGELYCQIKRSS